MVDSDSAAGAHVSGAFELLSHEVRLSILLALWDAYDPYREDTPVPFSELYDRVSVRDSGNFTYHLDKLTGHFVAETDGGYHLRSAGLTIVRAIIAGAGLDEQTLAPTALGMPCNRCGDGQLEISYRNEAVYLTCTDCEGITTTEEFPPGTIGEFEFDPAGLAGRSPPELLGASLIKSDYNMRMMKTGVCPDCSGPIEDSLQICTDHAPAADEVCSNCGTRDSVRVRLVCTVCKNRNRIPPQLSVVDHPAVVSFYHDHGVDPRWGKNDPEAVIQQYRRYWETEHSLVSVEPVRLRVRVPCDGDQLVLTLDEDLAVVEVDRTP